MDRGFVFLWRAIAALVAVVGLSLIVALLFPQQILTVDSGDVKADALVVLGGGSVERPERAAGLFREGAAPLVLVSGTGDNVLNVHVLETNGVPAVAIRQESRSTSTRENAEFSVPLLRQMGAQRVIIVTTWYHSRRALACFRHFAPDLTFYSRPSYFAYPRGEWNRRGTGGYVATEFVKLPGYWVCYGVRPW